MIDQEAQTAQTNTALSPSALQPGSPTPQAVTEPLRVNTLPKDFEDCEPKPQSLFHHLTPQQGADAGIEPPTPVLRAIKDREGRTSRDSESLTTMLARGPDSIADSEKLLN